MDDLERLAAHFNMELIGANRHLIRHLLEIVSVTCESDRQFESLKKMVIKDVGDTMARLKTAGWAWSESLRLYNGQKPSEFVSEDLEIPRWDPDWVPEERS